MRIVLPGSFVNALQEYQGTVDLSALVEDVPELVLMQPVIVEASGAWCDRGFSLDVKQVAAVDLECARCLNRFPLELKSCWEETFPKETKEVDLVPRVRESMLLELPMIAICASDCTGLCVDCGGRTGACSCPEQEVGVKSQ